MSEVERSVRLRIWGLFTVIFLVIFFLVAALLEAVDVETHRAAMVALPVVLPLALYAALWSAGRLWPAWVNKANENAAERLGEGRRLHRGDGPQHTMAQQKPRSIAKGTGAGIGILATSLLHFFATPTVRWLVAGAVALFLAGLAIWVRRKKSPKSPDEPTTR
jgi:hypothetical protein